MNHWQLHRTWLSKNNKIYGRKLKTLFSFSLPYLILILDAVITYTTDSGIETIIGVFQSLLALPPLLLIAACLRPRWSLTTFSLMAAMILFLEKVGVFTALHIYLIEPIYTVIAGDGSLPLNPQYTLITFYAVAIIVWCKQAIWRKQGTPLTYGLLFISSIILGGALLLHRHMIDAPLKNYSQASYRQFQALRYSDTENRFIVCRDLGYICGQTTNTITTIETLPVSIQRDINNVIEHYRANNITQGDYFYSNTFFDISQSTKLQYQAYFNAESTGVYYIIDTTSFQNYFSMQANNYAISLFYASMLWVAGGVPVTFWHENRRRRKKCAFI